MNRFFRMMFILWIVEFALCLSSIRTSFAEDQIFTLAIKNHHFLPEELTIPANKKIKLSIQNNDATPEEFESFDLNREKVVPGEGKITVFLGPLKSGWYSYFGDFHKKTAKGIIVVK